MTRSQGLNLVVNQPGVAGGGGGASGAALAAAVGRNPADPAAAARRLQGGAAGSGAAATAAAAAAGAMANEGRWTDNGQPLTAAEGRTVLPLLDQVEQAIVARLLPSQAVVHEGARRADGGASAGAGEGGARDGGVEEGKEEPVSGVLFCCFCYC